jgi:hypothetical protein
MWPATFKVQYDKRPLISGARSQDTLLRLRVLCFVCVRMRLNDSGWISSRNNHDQTRPDQIRSRMLWPTDAFICGGKTRDAWPFRDKTEGGQWILTHSSWYLSMWKILCVIIKCIWWAWRRTASKTLYIQDKIPKTGQLISWSRFLFHKLIVT